MVLLVEFKFGIGVTIKMDANIWDATDSFLRVPKVGSNFLCFFILNDNFTSKAEITIEPSSPDATTILLNVHLLETKFILNLVVWSKLNNW